MTGDARQTPDSAGDGKFGRSSKAVRQVVASNDNAYRSAQRHSSRVRVLKIMLPALATVMLAAFFGYTWLVTPTGLSVDVGGSGFADGKLVMANPKLDGFTRDNLAYSMTAARAIQDLTGSSAIALEDIAARMPLSADNWATIAAASGLYDRAANTLDITSEMTVTTTEGMVAKLRSARIDIASGNLDTHDPVAISMKGTRIAADSMNVSENGKVLVFDRRVRVTMSNGATDVSQASGVNK